MVLQREWSCSAGEHHTCWWHHQGGDGAAVTPTSHWLKAKGLCVTHVTAEPSRVASHSPQGYSLWVTEQA